MSQYESADPLTVLRADDPPVQPDPEFAARLRSRLEETTGTVTMAGAPRKYAFRNRTSTASGPRTVRLRNVAAVVAACALVLGVGGVWSVRNTDHAASTRDEGVATGLLDENYKSGAGMESAPPAAMPTQLPRQMPTQIANGVPPAPPESPQDNTVESDIVTTGSLMIVVAQPAAAADRLVDAVTAAGGRVDSRSEQSGSSAPTVNLTLRIPPDKVDAVLGDARNLGTVESMSINHTDVTSQRVDLDARVKALQTSVDRLLELMRRAGDVADLLAAESTLTDRQAELDSLKAQRAQLGDEIAYATISVSLSAEPTVERGGFAGALASGWHAMVSAAHTVVVTVGFLLPWVPVLLVLALVVRYVVRRRRKARQVDA